jgi:DNA-binding transcriptional LysR family regulator
MPRPAHHQIVAVDHLGPAADAKDNHHIRRRAAFDLFGVLGVIGDEAAADFVGVGAAHHHGVAAGELAVDPDHAGRQQALAGAKRRDGAGVDSSDVLLRLAMEGVGIVRLGELAVARALRNGSLEPLLLDVQVSEGYPLWALLPPGRQRSPKVKVFLEFLTERLGLAPWRAIGRPKPLDRG